MPVATSAGKHELYCMGVYCVIIIIIVIILFVATAITLVVKISNHICIIYYLAINSMGVYIYIYSIRVGCGGVGPCW
jgi:carbon starvation protein CstA